jgi:ABC-type nitrate/sulfonate/bicarbonate transport system permease component
MGIYAVSKTPKKLKSLPLAGHQSVIWWRTAIPFVFLLIMWQLLSLVVRQTMVFGNLILPGIDTMILKDFPELATLWGGLDRAASVPMQAGYIEALKVLAYHSMHTLIRVFGGTAIGLVAGLGLGLLIGYIRTIRRLFSLPIQIMRMIPLLALSLLFIMWFGGAELGSYLYVAFGVFVTIVVYTLTAIENFPPIYLNLAATLGSNRRNTFLKVVIPGILPELAGGLKVSIGMAWAIDLGGEYLAIEAGLGRMILISEWFQQTGKMIILLSLIVLYAVLANYAVTRACDRITRWLPRRETS